MTRGVKFDGESGARSYRHAASDPWSIPLGLVPGPQARLALNNLIKTCLLALVAENCSCGCIPGAAEEAGARIRNG